MAIDSYISIVCRLSAEYLIAILLRLKVARSLRLKSYLICLSVGILFLMPLCLSADVGLPYEEGLPVVVHIQMGILDIDEIDQI